MAMRLIVVGLLASTIGAACAARSTGPAWPPERPHRPPPPPVQAAPPRVHPDLPLDAGGAAAVAQHYAWQRGLPTEVKKVEREGDSWEVRLKVDGNGMKGKLRIFVGAYTGAIAVVEDDVRPHDRGRGPDGDRDEEKEKKPKKEKKDKKHDD